MTITKDTIIGDILNIAPQTAPLFMGIGMHCLGCPASRGETVEQACMVHGVDVDDLLQQVNAMIAAENGERRAGWIYSKKQETKVREALAARIQA